MTSDRADAPTYDAIIVGTGFASSFFLAEYLQRAAPTDRILVLSLIHISEWVIDGSCAAIVCIYT